ncbi:MAG: hypothetical protein ACODAG_07725 [Myxococcota bacterium]
MREPTKEDPRDTHARILAGSRTVHLFRFPGSEGLQVGMRALSDVEMEDARIAARSALRARGAGSQATRWDPSLLESEATRHVLFRATTDPEDVDRPFFGSPAELGELDEETISVLRTYQAVVQEAADPWRSLTDEDIRELSESLSKRVTKVDAIRARHAEGIVAYYGLRCAREASLWQVLYYWKLVNHGVE